MLYAKMPPQRSSVPSTIATSFTGMCLLCSTTLLQKWGKTELLVVRTDAQIHSHTSCKKKRTEDRISLLSTSSEHKLANGFSEKGLWVAKLIICSGFPCIPWDVHKSDCQGRAAWNALNLHYFQSCPRTAKHDILFSSKGFFGNLPLNVLWNNSSKKRKNKYGQTQWEPSYKIPH